MVEIVVTLVMMVQEDIVRPHLIIIRGKMVIIGALGMLVVDIMLEDGVEIADNTPAIGPIMVAAMVLRPLQVAQLVVLAPALKSLII